MYFIPQAYSQCNETEITVTSTTGMYGNEMSWELYNSSDMQIASFAGQNNDEITVDTICIPDGCYIFRAIDSYGDGWNGGKVEMSWDNSSTNFVLDDKDDSEFDFKFGINKTNCLSGVYNDVINGLIDHINGEVVLTDNDFINNHDLLVQNTAALSADMELISKSFELLDLFEATYGALFTTSNTLNGFNRQYASDGLNLHRNIILVHQGLIDYTYTEENLQGALNLLEGKLFQTAHYFPGFVDIPESSEVIENATVKCSYLLTTGSQPWATIGNPNVVRPTGCYLAPGSIAEIMVPESLIGKGVKIRVGAHFWDLKNKASYKRLDRVSITYDVNDANTKIGHPLGGGIYLEIPLGVDEGLLDITLKNVVRSPFYSKKTFHETSLSDWLEVERNHAAPWTDFETDKFMMQVPTSWIYEFDDPKTLLEEWDKSMDAVSDLLGRPRIADRHKNYLQFDVVIRGSAYHPGYPMSNTPYNPNDATNGIPNHNILKGPQYDQDIHFHELGHEVAISKFEGETEALVNFLYVPVLNKGFDYSLDEAFQKSFGPSYNYTSTKDNTTRTRLVADSFHEGSTRNICSCTKNEVRYQHRGYAHYVDIVDLYGWEALEMFWKSESDAADMGTPFPVNNQPQDDRIFRMSKAAGVDLRPLFHFWGIHPNDQDALAQRMEDNNLALPMSIKSKLHQYRELIPSNYDEFVAFGNELNPDFLDYSGSQFDFGAGWYQVTAETYDEAKAMEIEQALSDIIILYYGSDCFEVEEFLTPEFSFETQYCKSNEVSFLPSTSDNGIDGGWLPKEIDASEVGQFEYSFVPDLDECSVESKIMIEITEITTSIVGELNLCYGSSTTLYTDASYASYSWVLDGLLLSESDSVEVAQGGMISLFVTDANGCLGEVEILIMENEQIDINIEVTQPLCYGDYGSALFVPIGGPGIDYIYSIDGDSLLPGTYDMIVTDDLGCFETFEFEVVQPDPIDVSIEITQPLCHGDYGSALFVPVGGLEIDYIYSIDGDSLLSGTYDMIATDNLGCSEIFEFEVVQPEPIIIDLIDNVVSVTGGIEPYNITIDTSDNVQIISVVDANGCLSLAEFILTSLYEEYNESVRIFPNPATDKLYLDIAAVNSKIESLQLVSINGQLIRRFSKNNSILDLSQVKSGVHILQISFENGSRINKRVLIL